MPPLPGSRCSRLSMVPPETGSRLVQQSWEQLPERVDLPTDEVHLWCVALDLPPLALTRLTASLSTDEHARAGRLLFEHTRRRFVAGRGILRSILGWYLGVDPCSLSFTYGPQGKPVLAGQPSSDTLTFNISHSAGLAVYAVACGRSVGVDIEHVRPLPHADDIVCRFFSPRERAMFATVPPALRERTFFSGWTRKEAYAKARGDGIEGFNRFDVSLAPAEPAELLGTHDHPADVHRWQLKDLHLDDAHVGALAVEGDGWQPRYVQWHMPERALSRGTVVEAGR